MPPYLQVYCNLFAKAVSCFISMKRLIFVFIGRFFSGPLSPIPHLSLFLLSSYTLIFIMLVHCPFDTLPWGDVPSATAQRSSGITTPSSESGSPEHQRYSTAVPASSIVRPISRINVFFPTPGPPFKIIKSYVFSISTISENRC